MFEEHLFKHRIGMLTPLAVIDTQAAEFYRLAPPGILLVMIPLGLEKFSATDVERVFAPLNEYLDRLMDRGVHMVTQNGVPLPILIGLEAHQKMIAHIAAYTGVPATSTVLAVGRAARHLGMKKLALVNKWTEPMNKSLGEFLALEGVAVCGTATKELTPDVFQKLDPGDHMRLAYELGRQAFLENPDCDGIYIGGGTWLAEPVSSRLEEEFGKPALCNQTVALWDNLHILNDWKPLPGRGRLLGSA
jgi:maleate cis-trans isomerase